jgi:hypothetical protein
LSPGGEPMILKLVVNLTRNPTSAWSGLAMSGLLW